MIRITFCRALANDPIFARQALCFWGSIHQFRRQIRSKAGISLFATNQTKDPNLPLVIYIINVDQSTHLHIQPSFHTSDASHDSSARSCPGGGPPLRFEIVSQLSKTSQPDPYPNQDPRASTEERQARRLTSTPQVIAARQRSLYHGVRLRAQALHRRSAT